MYRVAITQEDVGSRVTLRRAVPEGVSDVVGDLLSWSFGVLSVRRRDGSVVTVVEADLVAARVVPAAATRVPRVEPRGEPRAEPRVEPPAPPS